MGYKYYRIRNHDTKSRQKPTRSQLAGLSCSEFKTALKRVGFKIRRDFFKMGCIAKRGNRRYRFRWWSEDFACDVSCPLPEFDRWANSTDVTKSIAYFLSGYKGFEGEDR